MGDGGGVVGADADADADAEPDLERDSEPEPEPESCVGGRGGEGRWVGLAVLWEDRRRLLWPGSRSFCGITDDAEPADADEPGRDREPLSEPLRRREPEEGESADEACEAEDDDEDEGDEDDDNDGDGERERECERERDAEGSMGAPPSSSARNRSRSGSELLRVRIVDRIDRADAEGGWGVPLAEETDAESEAEAEVELEADADADS